MKRLYELGSGRNSKVILDSINICLCTNLSINQWKYSVNVIEWFKRIERKQLYKFFMFGIKYLYPSIQKELLNKGLKFAERYKYTSDKYSEIIYHALKSLSF